MTAAVGRLAALPDAAPRLDLKWVLIGVPVALVVWLALVPLVFLVWESFLTPQTASAPAQLTLENFRAAYFSPDNVRLLANSLQFVEVVFMAGSFRSGWVVGVSGGQAAAQAMRAWATLTASLAISCSASSYRPRSSATAASPASRSERILRCSVVRPTPSSSASAARPADFAPARSR